MTSVGQAVTAEPATTATAGVWISRQLGFAAVAVALLSALVTFVVLAGLTPIAPTDLVVKSLLLANDARIWGEFLSDAGDRLVGRMKTVKDPRGQAEARISAEPGRRTETLRY